MIAGLRANVIAGTSFWLLIVVLIGLVDLSTGPDYGFGNFYFLAVLPAAWLVGRQPGIAIALASGFTWFFVDLVERRTTSLGPILWNGTSRMLLFVLGAVLIDIVRRERERMRALDRQRSQFMRVLEHELAGPGQELSRGLRALQRSGGASPEQLQPLVERAQDLEFLSRDFVSLGKLQSGELWLQHRATDLAALVEDLRTRSTATEPRIPLTLSSGSFVLEGDEARLRQAIGSLLTEARAAQTPDVSIDLRRDGANAKLTITGGVGPFILVDPDDRGGVGVELARVIIHAHRGQLEHLRSAASKAARFVVQLPLG